MSLSMSLHNLFNSFFILLIAFSFLGISGCATHKAFVSNENEVQSETEKLEPLKVELSDSEQLKFQLDYAVMLIKNGQLGKAEKVLSTLRHEQEFTVDSLVLLAEIYEKKNQAELALLTWKQLLKLEPDDEMVQDRFARAAMVCEQYDLSDNIYRKWILGKGHLRFRGFSNLGFSLMIQKEYEQAEVLFKQAIEIDPLNKKARSNLALLYQLQGKYEQAREQLRYAGFELTTPQEKEVETK
jgi:Tfp pilus assembly protein PilF